MFMGEFHPTLDEKYRVAIPMKLRRAFGDDAVVNKLVITHGFDKCIMAFREQDWKEFVEKKLVPLAMADPMNRKRMRFLMGGASDCELDKQGRVVIPAHLLQYSEIKRDTTILGLYDRIEIWATEQYDQYKPDGSSMGDFARELGF
ncbi:MAG: division/cell wall cluster transcriptional repressor MraZ [Spirochaetes bacterium]|nr:division/cell wall cluster transcriptional repressor MraZ [Spirochaetota bacterium]